MTAPALVMVARGSSDPEVAQVAHEMRLQLQQMRPDFSISAAFLDHCSPNAHQVVNKLVRQDHSEIVLVPLQLTHAIEICADMQQMVQRMRSTFPRTKFVVSRPIGPEASLLNILDERLRNALRLARALELDGLVLSSEATGDIRGNALLARRARQWSTHHKLPCLTAVADGSGPSTAQAIQGLRSQGRRHIAVGSYFLTADDAFHRQAELAYRFGAVAVSDPLGAHPEVLDLVLARYAFAAMELLEFEGETEATDEQLQTVGA